jgi:GntR family transcriptional regulator/MocR family aminotransferase
MLTLNFNDNSPLYEQLYIYIRSEIESGNIGSGEKLPSKRALASHLKISVVTVETAYSQLLSEGYIYSVPGSGFYAETLPDRIKPSAKKNISLPKIEKPEFEFDFRTNRVDTDCFPFSVWAKLSREILSAGSDELLQSCNGKGVYELRQAISDYLREFRGMNVFPEQIVVGAGGEYLTGLLVQLLGRDKIYGVEEPGYVNTYKVFQANCHSVVPIELDSNGASVKSLVEQNVQIAHITPSHHFPLGTVMPATRRHELLAWAESGDGRYIIEDDYDSDFRLYGKPMPTLQSLDVCNRVVYLNTFTKSLAPSMRIGYMVLPLELTNLLDEKLGFYACTVPVFEQLILAEFMKRGYFERHISRMRKLYLARRDFFIDALNSSKLSDILYISGANAGMHLMLTAKNNLSESELVARAAKGSVRVYGLSEYYSFGECRQKKGSVIVGYSGMSNDELAAGIHALEKAWL